MMPILQVGPFAVQLPGLILLAGVWVGVLFAEHEAPRRGVSKDEISNLVFVGLMVGLVGARLWYALRFLDVYLDQPLALLALNPTTIAPLEGALTGLVAAMIYGQRKGMSLWPTVDALAPGLAAFMVFVGFANLASGDAFGATTSMPWGIALWGEIRHPTQLYSVGMSLIILWAVWQFSRNKAFPGFLFLAWLLMAAAVRLFLEAFRGDSIIVFGGFRQGQLLSLLLVALSLVALRIRADQASASS